MGLRESHLESLPMRGFISHINDIKLYAKNYEKSSRSFVGKQLDWIC